MDDKQLIARLRTESRPYEKQQLDQLVEAAAGRQCVMLGEATHGSHEFYARRADLTKRLVENYGFRVIAVEGDWPACYAVNRYVKGYHNAGPDAETVLRGFDRWPTWMWANQEMVALIEWLRAFNQERPASDRVGFYGLDVYSLWDSMRAVLEYLERTDPLASQRAREAYRCFDPYGGDEQAYAYHTALVPDSCREDVIEVLNLTLERGATYPDDPEADLNAEQNARVVAGAEEYYRAMMAGNRESWNVRDRHMAYALRSLMRRDGGAKAVVWAHNTHIGDARATDMAPAGMVNLGQLGREMLGEEHVFLLGFATYAGEVIAGTAWDGPMQVMELPPAREDSWDALMHRVEAADQIYFFDHVISKPAPVRDQRAVGVVYDPRYERSGNYVPTALADRYDALIFIDRTKALQPLKVSMPVAGETPDTYPAGY